MLVSLSIGYVLGYNDSLPKEYYRATENLSYKSAEGVSGLISKGSILAMKDTSHGKLAFINVGIILEVEKLPEYTEALIEVPDTFKIHRYAGE